MEDQDYLLSDEHDHGDDKHETSSLVPFYVVGLLTMTYAVSELFLGIAIDSLTIVSDAFHNLSDVLAVVICVLTIKLSTKAGIDAEKVQLIGALVNTTLLLALSLSMVLQSVPMIYGVVILGERNEMPGVLFIVSAGVGFIVNLIGTVIFACMLFCLFNGSKEY